MSKLYIEILGCQMNKSDSERIIGMLSHFGYVLTQEPKEADLLIVNTCSIRQLSEDKAYSLLGVWGKWKQKKPNLKIGICGCVAQQKFEKIKQKFPYVDLIFGTHNIYELPSLIKKIENDEKVCSISNEAVEEQEYEIIRKDKLNAWVPIMEGCNNFCTYCVVPYTRGRERSRTAENIIKEVKDCVKQGFKEITLLGQNVDSYGKVKKENETFPTLAKLLEELNNIEGNFRIRFVTSYPTDITDELIETVKKCDKVCEYFHIPMQSGNDTVLKKMNRRYNREEYFNIVNKIRKEIEDVTITSDFIAGFPSETEEQFLETLSAVELLDYSNTAAYSPREQTVAARWVEEYLSEEVKKERLARLNETNKKACLESNKKFIGKTLNVLVENVKENQITGRARNNKIVHFDFDENIKVGDFVDVEITEALVWCVKGKIV